MAVSRLWSNCPLASLPRVARKGTLSTVLHHCVICPSLGLWRARVISPLPLAACFLVCFDSTHPHPHLCSCACSHYREEVPGVRYWTVASPSGCLLRRSQANTAGHAAVLSHNLTRCPSTGRAGPSISDAAVCVIGHLLLLGLLLICPKARSMGLY